MTIGQNPGFSTGDPLRDGHQTIDRNVTLAEQMQQQSSVFIVTDHTGHIDRTAEIEQIADHVTSPTETQREDLEDVAAAAMKRLTESLRSIEEYSKVVAASHTLDIERMRYNAYTLEQRLMGQAILAKTVGELCSTFHPRLKRFTSSSGRTGIAYALHIQDGVSSIMHTVLPGGALTDLGRQTIGDGLPVIGHDFAPSQAATLALDAPWAPAWYGSMVEAKPVPYQMTATYKMWGGFSQTPLWKRSFQARHYGVASLDLASNESIPFLVHWRNRDAKVESSESLGMLIGRFGVNRTELLDSIWHNSKQRNPNGSVGNQGGVLCSIQHRNRLFVLSSPFYEDLRQLYFLALFKFGLMMGRLMMVPPKWSDNLLSVRDEPLT